jgi:curli production assembly/transport component CsgG
MLRRLLYPIIISILSAGCSLHSDILPSEMFATEPTIGARTKSQEILETLPPAAGVVTVSVYSYADYTGQQKPNDVPEYSKAVTQGGLPILKKALMDVSEGKWFRVLERGGLQDLLQERQLIRSIRESYTTADGRKLPELSPLLYSGLLLEGGIVSYESNITTGGLGARYLGIGGSTEYSRDIVTVYLRAVSVSNGEVLISVNSSKTIYSTGINGGIFKYVSFDKIVESEAGYTVNEPPQLAVRQAIEMAVYSLIMEGYKKKLWEFENLQQGLAAYERYRERIGIPIASDSGAPLPSISELENSSSPSKLPQTATQSAANPVETVVAPETVKADQESFLPSEKASGKDVSNKSSLPQPTADKASASASNVRSEAQVIDRSATKPDEQSLIELAVERTPPGWYVQFAAIQREHDQRQVNGILHELQAAGFPVTIQRAQINTIWVYRVLAGPYTAEGLARSAASKGWQQLSEWFLEPPFVRLIR